MNFKIREFCRKMSINIQTEKMLISFSSYTKGDKPFDTTRFFWQRYLCMYYLKLYREKEGNSNKRSDTLGKRGNKQLSISQV